MDERRRRSRVRIDNDSATIVFERQAYGCTVRNLSAAGAALDIAWAQVVPDTFNLVMGDSGSSRECRVVWRKEKQLGVTFAS